MNSNDWVATLSPLVVVGVGVATTVYARIASKAGREIRTLRGQLEEALRVMHDMRLIMAANGIPKTRLPRLSDALAEADPWSDWTRADDGSDSQ